MTSTQEWSERKRGGLEDGDSDDDDEDDDEDEEEEDCEYVSPVRTEPSLSRASVDHRAGKSRVSPRV